MIVITATAKAISRKESRVGSETVPSGVLNQAVTGIKARLRENALAQIASQGRFGGKEWPPRKRNRESDFREFKSFAAKYSKEAEFEDRPLLVLSGRLLRAVAEAGQPKVVEAAPGRYNVSWRGPRYMFAHHRGVPYRKSPLPARPIFTMRQLDIDYIGGLVAVDFARHFVKEFLNG